MATKMIRYLRLFLSFAKNCFLGELEFRANFVMWIGVNIFWSLVTLLLADMVFGQAQTIAGWTKYEGLILFATQMIFASLLWVFILPNVIKFSLLIRKGELDFVLVKPVSPRFLVATRLVEFDNLPRAAILPFLIGHFLRLGGFYPSGFQVLGYTVLLVLGLFIFANFLFVLMTTNFWFTNIFNLESLADAVLDLGRFPAQIFTGFAKIVLVYLVPAIFIATIPVQFLLGKSSPTVFFYATFVAAASYVVSHQFWRLALRHYSSASS